MSIVGELIAEFGTVLRRSAGPAQDTAAPRRRLRDGRYRPLDILTVLHGKPVIPGASAGTGPPPGPAIPSDNDIRLMLDGAAPDAFDSLFMGAIEKAGPLTRFQCLGRHVLIARDGSEYFGSRKISCPQCSTRRHSDGGAEYFHAFLGATIVVPGHHQVLPLLPSAEPPQSFAEGLFFSQPQIEEVTVSGTLL